MAGLGGLLSGLKGGFSNAMQGTTPELRDTSGPGFMDERRGMIKPPISLEATGGTTGGLLDKIKAPDSRGLTFGDKLFAAGSILQRDPGGAATFLQNQRGIADQMAQRDKAQGIKERFARAFRNNIGPDGQMNFQGLMAEAGDDFDPMDLVGLRKATRPDIVPMSGPRGALMGFNKDTGTASTLVPGEAQQQQLFNPDGSINQQYIRGRSQEAEAIYGGRRRGAPPVGRRPPVIKGGVLSDDEVY